MAGLVESKLYRLHHKGPVATKFIRPQRVVHTKPKTIPELKLPCSRPGMTFMPQTTINAFQSVVYILSIRCKLCTEIFQVTCLLF